MFGTVSGDLGVSGTVTGDLRVYGTVTGEFVLTGGVDGGLDLGGRFATNVVLTPKTNARLTSVRAGRFTAPVFVGDKVDISGCDFRQCADIAQFELVGGDLFPPDVDKIANPPAGSASLVPAHEMASIYRQLRVNLEGRSNRPAAALFYRGEMNARLAAARERGPSIERGVLAAYKWVSMYGQSIARPLVAFVVASIAGWGIFAVNGLDLKPDEGVSQMASWDETWMYAVRSMLSFLNPPEADLSTMDTVGQIWLRITGPVLIALTALAVRDRVAR